ncbi:AAA family ATPase [Streptomyces sp. NPDC127106]|uniref:AAA family ATPase n=1 Tax=Streptomyces sp. NPDC127106 TaxID=3345360 RepID=UPI003627720B
MIVWLNGPFGGGKTSLAREIVATRPGHRLYDPELVGYLVRDMVGEPPSGDFQDAPIWRSLVVRTALELLHHYGELLVVPMSVLRPDYLAEIHGGLRDHGVELHHFFLEVDAPELRRRIEAQVIHEDDPVRDADVRKWRLDQVERCLAARRLMPRDTVFIDSQGNTPEGNAGTVMDIVARNSRTPRDLFPRPTETESPEATL